MVREILDPGTSKLKEARYTFQVMGVPEKVAAGSTTKRVWKLQPMDNGAEDSQPIKYGVVPWQAGEIIVATGGSVTTDGKFEWDPDAVDGRCFSADVKYIKADPSNPKNINKKTGQPYENLVLSNFTEEQPF